MRTCTDLFLNMTEYIYDIIIFTLPELIDGLIKILKHLIKLYKSKSLIIRRIRCIIHLFYSLTNRISYSWNIVCPDRNLEQRGLIDYYWIWFINWHESRRGEEAKKRKRKQKKKKKKGQTDGHKKNRVLRLPLVSLVLIRFKTWLLLGSVLWPALDPPINNATFDWLFKIRSNRNQKRCWAPQYIRYVRAFLQHFVSQGSTV